MFVVYLIKGSIATDKSTKRGVHRDE